MAEVHFCGAHARSTTAWAAAEDVVLDVDWLGVIYSIVSNALFLWIVIGTALVGSVPQDQHKEMLQDYAEMRIALSACRLSRSLAQLSQQALLLDAKVRRQEGQIAALNLRRWQQGRDHHHRGGAKPAAGAAVVAASAPQADGPPPADD